MAVETVNQATLDLKVPTILIVDDNPTNLGVVMEYLEDQGLIILIARDGGNALQKAEYAHPDLILLDVMMPGIDGFETCRRLKANPITAKIPVIFMTALAETINKVEGFRAGAVDYVTKPIQQEELLARVTTHLRLQELTENLEQLVVKRTAELQEAYEKLTRLDKAKSEFIQVISHELRTPLAIIDGYTQLLKSSPTVAQDDELQGITGHILQGSRRILEVVNNTLDATRIAQDSLNLIKEATNLQKVIEKASEKFRAALQERQIGLTMHNLDVLPDIEVDPDLLQRAFSHVIVNAIKYTPDRGTITISGHNHPETNQVEVVVRDTGIGIETADLELIFEKFYRTDSAELHSSGRTNFKGGGPGLGLAIARGIIQAHGGKIWAESQGHNEETLPGSRFHVLLPVQFE